MPKVKASRNGQYPIGCHWVAGEVRDLDVKDDVPAWLEVLPEPAKKAKKTKKASE